MILQMTTADQLTMGTFVFSVVALIANFAINAVKEDDPTKYRIAVGGFGVCAIVPAAIAVFLAIYGIGTNRVMPVVVLYVGLAVFFTLLLTVMIVLFEIGRGIEDRKKVYVMLGVIPFVGLIAFVMNVFI